MLISVWTRLTDLTVCSNLRNLYFNWRFSFFYLLHLHIQWDFVSELLCFNRQMMSMLALIFLASTGLLNSIFLNVIIFPSSISWSNSFCIIKTLTREPIGLCVYVCVCVCVCVCVYIYMYIYLCRIIYLRLLYRDYRKSSEAHCDQ
jgi:hypothetical protein